jgi:hypothetical protein
MSETQYIESRIADFISESRRLTEVIKTKQLMIAELDSAIEQKRRAV